MTNRRARETIDAMRYIALIALVAACSGDDTATPTPDNIHDVVDCDTASYEAQIPGFPDGRQCERGCQVNTAATGPACTSSCTGSAQQCTGTFEIGGTRGCCYTADEPFVFCECE